MDSFPFKKRIASIILFLMILPTLLFPGTTGKIAGTVTDAKTGQPLPGCNIIITGTTYGAASNARGDYYIINISPGRYEVRAAMMGYKTLSVIDVRIMTDLTTHIDFKLEPTVLEFEEEITVVAERPLVQKDITSKLSVVSSDEITNMPVDNFQEILVTKAGFTKDASGNIHVRGGRSGEIAYMIDGMAVANPLYGGFSSMMNEDAIDEMIVLSGAFNAEFGDAMSSVVNIITKEGSDSYHGKLEYTSPRLTKSPYRQKNAFAGIEDSYDYTAHSILDDLDFDPLKLDIPIAGMFNASISGPVPLVRRLYFFASGRYENEDSYLPHGYDLERDGLAKLTYRFRPSMKLSVSAQKTDQTYQRYIHAWKYLPEHQAVNHRNSNRLGFNWTHTVNPGLFYTINLSRYQQRLGTQVGDKLPAEYVRYQTAETVYFYISGDDDTYIDDQTSTYDGKLDVTAQVNAHHQFKSGVEFKQHIIEVYEESEPWSGGAQFKEQYERKPVEVAAYLQDKIEYDYLILNIGLRYDYADPKAAMWRDIRQYGFWDTRNNWVPAEEVAVDPKTQISPRIGLAHPITDRAVLHFSYGHFFQNPNYNSMYYNQHKDLSSTLPLVGNPGAKAQKTIAYETGIKFQFSDNWALDASAWYKDITDLLSTLHVSYLSNDYVVFYNSDYASVKGIDLTLRKKLSHFISGSIDYTYMVAKGNNSQPLGGYLDAFAQEEIPHQEYYLDFDQRHDVAIILNLMIPQNQGLEFYNIRPFSDVSANLLIQAGSGLPYTPYVDPTLRVEINSARKPWTATVDFRVIKKFAFFRLKPAIFLEVNNLLDRKNVVQVYSRTGKPFDTGQPGLVGSSPDADHDPTHISPPRSIKAGIQLLW
ncbi:TonB-dependent receptor [candidate division KSB1 bacterium]|nr:TonB-dependent receptor [candidate division KSB1 bacterium]